MNVVGLPNASDHSPGLLYEQLGEGGVVCTENVTVKIIRKRLDGTVCLAVVNTHGSSFYGGRGV